MKKLLLIPIVIFFLHGCSLTKKMKIQAKEIPGKYIRNESTEKLELNPDGTFKLFRSEMNFTPVFEQCDIASKGKWSIVSNDVIELTSEDNYLKQKGFEYELKKENKFSQDSLYIKVNFPSDYHPIKLNFYFNHKNNKSIKTEQTYIVIPKSKHLWERKISNNQISFNLDAIVSGTTLYKSRVLFSIFEENIDTEKYNYLTITLTGFDRCFLEFEPLNKELLFIKNSNQIFWQGNIWKK